jgi:hypothetical protein
MLRFAPLLLLLIAAPVSGMDMASVEAIINSCQKGQICSCPRAKLKSIDSESACGKAPPGPDYHNLTDATVKAYGGQVEVYTKCMQDVFYTNLKIYKYNEIFDRCQRSENSSSFKNKPPHEIYSGDGKTLNEQVQDVKAAERAQEQALRQQEAARQAVEAARAAQDTPQASAPSPQAEQNQCFRNSRYGMNVQAGYGTPNFFLVCLDPNKTIHWGNDARSATPNGDGFATAGPNEFKMLMRSCLNTPTEYSCPECCRPTR